MPDLSIIAAYDLDRGIGRKGKLPWHVPTDLTRFRRITEGGAVIMGRKTWDSLPMDQRPLPNRINVVVTRNKRWKAKGVLAVSSLKRAIEITNDVAPTFVIGGQEIFEQALPLARRLYLTEVQCKFGCDRFFPHVDMSEWAVLRSLSPSHGYGDVHAARYMDLCRREDVVDMGQVAANARFLERTGMFTGVPHDA